jgi:hypothetical protein
MAEENPLLKADIPSAQPKARKETPASMPAEGNPLLQADTEAKGPIQQSDVGYAEDIARSALAKGVRGAAAVPGMFGDIPQIFGAEKYRPPTTEEYIEKLSNIHPAVREALQYKSQTVPGSYVGSAVEFLPTALLPTGKVSLGMRALSGLGAGVGSQAVEDVFRKSESPLAGTGYEAAGKLAGAVAGGLAAPFALKKAASAVSGAETVAARRLAEAGAKDIASRSAKAPPGALVDADLAPAVAGGAETQRLLKTSAARAGDEAVGAYNAAAENFRVQAAPRVQGVIDDIFQKPVQMFDEMDLLKQRVSQLNDANYTRVMGLPHAQNITHPDLQSIVNRLPKGTIDDVLEQFRIRGQDPATFGLVKTKKGWQIPPQGASLQFWDEVKQNLDSQVGSYIDPVTKAAKPGASGMIGDLTGLKNDLVTKVLDKAVPEYQPIRFEASEIYGARNAMEAGYKYYRDGNFKNLHNIEKLVDKNLTPAQKSDFAYGYAAAYKDALEKNPSAALGVYGGKTGGFNIEKMRFALGDQNANRLLGSVNSEYLNSTIKSLASGGGGAGVTSAAGKGALGAVLGEVALTGENLLQAMSFSMAPTAIAGAILAGTGKAIYSARERRIAEQVLRLAADPDQAERLGKLIASNPDARSFLAKFYQAAGKSVPPVAAQTTAPSPVKEENAGGRIGRATGGRISHEIEANRLVRMAEDAKKQIGNGTEQILNAPDELVVKALRVANEKLEG